MSVIKKKMKGFLSGLKKGALHRELHVPKGKNIPKSDLQVHSGDSALLRKRKNFARVAATWNKK